MVDLNMLIKVDLHDNLFKPESLLCWMERYVEDSLVWSARRVLSAGSDSQIHAECLTLTDWTTHSGKNQLQRCSCNMQKLLVVLADSGYSHSRRILGHGRLLTQSLHPWPWEGPCESPIRWRSMTLLHPGPWETLRCDD